MQSYIRFSLRSATNAQLNHKPALHSFHSRLCQLCRHKKEQNFFSFILQNSKLYKKLTENIIWKIRLLTDNKQLFCLFFDSQFQTEWHCFLSWFSLHFNKLCFLLYFVHSFILFNNVITFLCRSPKLDSFDWPFSL